MTLTPAYGRDYKSKKAVIEDWDADKDFIIASIFHGGGTYINKADAQREKIGSVTIRYAKLTKVTIVKV